MNYLHFVLSFGALLCLMVVISAWLFRTAAAPLWAKVAIPSLAVALGCYAPFAVNEMLGFPITVSMAQLPPKAVLLAYSAHDEEKTVDLWLRVPPNDVPRAYETELTGSLKKTLHEASEAMGRGGQPTLVKRGNRKAEQKGGGDPFAIGNDTMDYALDPNSLSSLPPKE